MSNIFFIGWSRELVVSAWNEDKSKVCAKAGLDLTEIHSKI